MQRAEPVTLLGPLVAWRGDNVSGLASDVFVQDVGQHGSGNFLSEDPYKPFLVIKVNNDGEVEATRSHDGRLPPEMMASFSVFGDVLSNIFLSLQDDRELKELFSNALSEVNNLFSKVSSAVNNNNRQPDTLDQSKFILDKLCKLKAGVQQAELQEDLVVQIETAIVEAKAMVQEAFFNLIMRDQDGVLEFSEEHKKLFPVEFFTALQVIDSTLLTKNNAIVTAPGFPDTNEATQSLPYVTELRKSFATVVYAAQGGRINFPIPQVAAQDGDEKEEEQQQDQAQQRRQFIVDKLAEFEKLYEKHKPIFHKTPWYIELGKWIAIATGCTAVGILVAGSLGVAAAAGATAVLVTKITSVTSLAAGCLSRHGFFPKDEIRDQLEIAKRAKHQAEQSDGRVPRSRASSGSSSG